MKSEIVRHVREFAARFRTKPNTNKPADILSVDTVSVPVAPSLEVVAAPVEVTLVPIVKAFEPIKLPESVGKPYDFLVAVADDWRSARTQICKGTEKALSLTEQNAGVLAPDNADDFFNIALRGKRGQQADIAFIDHDFGNEMSWRLNPLRIARLAQSIGRDFDRFTPKEERTDDGYPFWKFEDKRMSPMYWDDSVGYALVLRALGFIGRIYVTSGEPPLPKAYKEALNGVLAVVPTFHPGPLIDGRIAKGSFTGDFFEYGTRAGANGRWEDNSTIENTVAALNSLLKGQPS